MSENTEKKPFDPEDYFAGSFVSHKEEDNLIFNKVRNCIEYADGKPKDFRCAISDALLAMTIQNMSEMSLLRHLYDENLALKKEIEEIKALLAK